MGREEGRNREKNETVKLREWCGTEETEKNMRENGDSNRERG